MNIRFFGNAGVTISSKSGVTALCDPWFTQGAFMGSWFTYPPGVNDVKEELLNSHIDFLYISHLHPDHFDRKFIVSLLKQNEKLPIVIHKHSHPYLKTAILGMGLGTNLFETSYNSPFKFGDMSIQSISADACNPELCNRSIPCVMPHMKSIDSLAIFRADGQTILNANDAMSIASVLTISKFVDKVDLVLGHYGAASPFPQCFPDLRANDQLKDELVNGSIDNLICLAETVKAKYLFPFAGQYILGGKLTHLNSYRAVIESDEAVRRIRARGSSVTPFSLKVGAKFDLDNEEVEAEYLEPSKNEINDYVAVISKSKFPYENIKLERILADKEFLEGTTLRQASARVLRLANLTPKAWGVSYFIKTPHISFALNLSENSSFTEKPLHDTVTELSMPSELLYHLVLVNKNRKASFVNVHWNQADGGSHFEWYRKGVFNSEANYLLNYFNTVK